MALNDFYEKFYINGLMLPEVKHVFIMIGLNQSHSCQYWHWRNLKWWQGRSLFFIKGKEWCLSGKFRAQLARQVSYQKNPWTRARPWVARLTGNLSLKWIETTFQKFWIQKKQRINKYFFPFVGHFMTASWKHSSKIPLTQIILSPTQKMASTFRENVVKRSV